MAGPMCRGLDSRPLGSETNKKVEDDTHERSVGKSPMKHAASSGRAKRREKNRLPCRRGGSKLNLGLRGRRWSPLETKKAGGGKKALF